jgi:cytochrome oxidase Cu insertion factor (SCO1/SenC/PrrC family)
MTPAARARTALGALVAIVAITASWWALALWPTADAPAWVLRTRETCFGTARTGLPDAGGWLALVGQPLGMLAVLFAVWGGEVREGLRAAMRRVVGQLAVGAVGAAIAAGLLGVVVRVRVADASTFASSPTEALAGQLNRLNDAPKPFALVDQHGRTVTLEQFRGKPVLVSEVLGARARRGARAPAVLIVTLDPWRDTPSRLPSIAERWGATGDAHVLGGSPVDVERVLNAWRIPRARNERTGDVSHPSVVYVVGADGRIAYVVTGSEPLIRAAVEAL